MRRFYQESWHGIPFTAITHISFFHLADSRFYSAFYEELFRRYRNWNSLPEVWRRNKAWDAAWLAAHIRKLEKSDPARPLQILSIGSGVGYMEKCLLEECPDIDLHVNEPSTVGMKWLRDLLPQKRIYIGMPTASIPADLTFDMVYLSAVDYGMSAREFSALLDFLRAQLAPNGLMICISASLLEEDSLVGSLVNGMKNVIRCFLHHLDIRRQQFWGWRRTKKEYRQLFAHAGFENIEDGILDDGFDSYWISGTRPPAPGHRKKDERPDN